MLTIFLTTVFSLKTLCAEIFDTPKGYFVQNVAKIHVFPREKPHAVQLLTPLEMCDI